MSSVHQFKVEDIDGHEVSLSQYANQTMLIVNVASQCGLTPQYAALEQLYQKYLDRKLVVLGFPCNDFGGQEPGTETDIKAFCESTYNITFPLFAKIHVKGAEQSPLYAHLTSQPSHPDGSGDIAWNFAKFVVDARGRVVGRFSPQTEPFDPALIRAIEQTLVYNAPTIKPTT